MIPVVTPEEMGAIDAAAPEPTDVLIRRAGAAVAASALELLGGGYARRVVVIAGKGNNGADGRAAAQRLEARGVRVSLLDAAAAPPTVPRCDLVIDAAYGTGFRGEYTPPTVPEGTPVLAVDIPSGLSGRTGQAGGGPLVADRTVTFAAYKPGLLLGDGPGLAGEIIVADIGLDASSARAHLVEAADVAGWLPARARDTHKWKAALWVIAGSPGMAGAAHLATRGAQRAGAGYVRLSSPGIVDDPFRPTESVGRELPAAGWADGVIDDLARFAAVAVGPGLGTGEGTAESVRTLAARCTVPMVIDSDGLTALGTTADLPGGRATVLTPHDGEFERLGGDAGQADQIDATRVVAAAIGATVLRKGSTTIVAGPDGSVLLSNSGDSRLATAGTGDVLTGIIGGLLAQGMAPQHAAVAGAYLHGRAADLGWSRGLVAGDIPNLLPEVLARMALR